MLQASDVGDTVDVVVTGGNLVVWCGHEPACADIPADAMNDQFDLARFQRAQDTGRVYEQAVTELRAGRKSGHWMWFVFPQIAGLGRSPTAQRYAISSLSEARAYLEHPVLGARLRECASILAATEGRTAPQILGDIDALKLRSSMTLFARAAPDPATFEAVLDRYFDGIADDATDARLATCAG